MTTIDLKWWKQKSMMQLFETARAANLVRHRGSGVTALYDHLPAVDDLLAQMGRLNAILTLAAEEATLESDPLLFHKKSELQKLAGGLRTCANQIAGTLALAKAKRDAGVI